LNNSNNSEAYFSTFYPLYVQMTPDFSSSRYLRSLRVHCTNRRHGCKEVPTWQKLKVSKRQWRTRLRTLTCNQAAIRSSGLPFNDRHPRNPCNKMDYCSFTDPGGKEGWVGLVGWPIADTIPTKWPYMSTIVQA